MKTNIIQKFLLIIFVVSIFSSCDLFNNDEDKQPTDQYLVSYEKVATYLPALIESILTPLVDDYPGFAPIVSEIEHGVTVYKISYITSFNDDDVIASGLVCVPTAAGEFPILSYQNGTNTEHSKAPTVNPDNELFLLLEFMASTGFVVTIPDYLGFGTSENMFHPYLDGESTVQSILDMQRAVKEMVANYLRDEIGLELNNDYYITGYSQGGWSTMQLQKAIEEKYSDVFNLRASVCSAGPYDLNYINEYVLAQEEYPMPYFLGYIFN
ncbi:MAG: prolyl oligopeptidase family serine peptidase, partial [Draconibacterium sp.]|nr:prolyl oligopeptidase family serine peptidase [Draconibacterium sp.]